MQIMKVMFMTFSVVFDPEEQMNLLTVLLAITGNTVQSSGLDARSSGV